MRVAALLALALAGGCQAPDDYGYPPYDPGSGPPGGNGGCSQDSDCGTNLICARDFSCIAATDAYTAHITWTIAGQPATQAACAMRGDLDLDFYTSDDYWFGFSPIACDQGKFSIDKLPKAYVEVTLGPQGQGGTVARIDQVTGTAVLDLP